MGIIASGLIETIAFFVRRRQRPNTAAPIWVRRTPDRWVAQKSDRDAHRSLSERSLVIAEAVSQVASEVGFSSPHRPRYHGSPATRARNLGQLEVNLGALLEHMAREAASAWLPARYFALRDNPQR